MIIDLKQDLISKADAYCARRGISKPRLATIVHNDGKFFDRLERGGSFTVVTYEKFMRYFAEHEAE